MEDIIERIEQNIVKVQNDILNALSNINGKKEFYELQSQYIGKSGKITALLRELGKVEKEQRPAVGKRINELKNWAETQFSITENIVLEKALQERYEKEKIDLTLPAKHEKIGSLHPITHIRNELISIFEGLGFSVFEGPEIEDDFHNFTALNVPKDHPARDMQDTFFITPDILLRTQTSPGQIRTMEKQKPPIKVLVPGRVFRSDDDATHSPMFHQMEGLVVDKNLNLCDLYGILDYLAKSLFSKDTQTRLRPSFFPFTEPSVEVDVTCCVCHGKGCPLCKNTGWIEVLGGGIVHPNVLKNCGVDPNVYSGIALGIGMDRLAMLKYGIPNIKYFFNNDIRMLEQFK